LQVLSFPSLLLAQPLGFHAAPCFDAGNDAALRHPPSLAGLAANVTAAA
jgi:hypothetical protein